MNTSRSAAAALVLLLAAAPAVMVASAAEPAVAAPAGAAGASAPAPTPEQIAAMKGIEEILKGLRKRSGDIAVPEAGATLKLGEQYYFLDAADAKKIIVDVWGNPPQSAEGVLGMVFPAGVSPIDDGSWGAVLTWETVGYVKDEDAADIKPTELLEQLREGETRDNEQRTRAGYPTSHIAGWAETPRYDKTTHTAVWAKDIVFGDQPVHALNYDLRILGRSGVLTVSMVATMQDLAAVKAAADTLQRTVIFNPGQRYADYKPGDKVAAYGVAGMVAGGLGLAAAKKAGLLGVLLLILKKGWVVILAALGGIGAWLKRMFGGGRE